MVSRFPFTIGRERSADYSCQEPGVWDGHARLELDPDTLGFRVKSPSSAPILINGEAAHDFSLKNGSILTLGGVQIACWLSAAKQKSLTIAEGLTWSMILIVFAGQIALLAALLS